MRTFTSFFRPAAPAGIPLDYETAARARALQVILWTMLGVGLLVLVLAPFVSGTGPYLRLVRAVSIAYAIGGTLLFLNARGKTRQASILLIISFSLFATWLA